MIDVETQYLTEIRSILQHHVPDCEVRVFGSRFNGKAKRFSDIDLALVGAESLDWERIEALKDAFSESNLPIMVDVLDWNAISPEFRKIIEQGYEGIQKRG
jgi:predicted nucleotidyltransferase